MRVSQPVACPVKENDLNKTSGLISPVETTVLFFSVVKTVFQHKKHLNDQFGVAAVLSTD